jgi:glycosyltransferase involved in cell wall biosynthesis
MENVHFIPLPGCRLLPVLLTLGSVLVPAIARRYGLDLVHDPTGALPFLFGTAHAHSIVTIHDVFVWSCPGNSSLLDTIIYRYWLPPLLSSGRQTVITDSDQSRRDIEKYLSVPASRLQVIPCGIGAQFRPLPPDSVRAELRIRFGISWPYILFVGSLTQRKNIARSLQAFAQLAPSFPDLRFVIAGPRSWKGTPVESLVAELGLHERVFLTGPVTDSDLPLLYNGARVFVFPSLYEGFGLPPLEAMACGVPVVTSNVSSLPEVVGEAALLVDPLDVDAIASAMLRLLSDPILAADLHQKGVDQAARFTWEHTSRETLSVYQKVLDCS